MNDTGERLSDTEIIALRPAKNVVDPGRPYACFVEAERAASGRVENVATIFLTNHECPFRCVFCDLWKNTTDLPVPPGAIPEQIDFALGQLPEAAHIKLYNSGNFFDPRAIPRSDLPAIADRVRRFQTVIVENHPRLCSDDCLRFRDRIGTRLELAMGLETVHPEVLPRLNKQMTVGDFDRAVGFLTENGIAVRAFILLRPPWLTEEEGGVWALRSIEHAFAAGAECCSLIPVRGGNGIMERLKRAGNFSPPSLQLLESVMEASLRLKKGRVFADVWDAPRLGACPRCRDARIERLRQMNLSQAFSARPACDCEERR